MYAQKLQFIRTDIGRVEYPFQSVGYAVGSVVPCIFRDFELTRLPVKAELKITALGIFEPWVNGKRVGNRWFAPGWTDYNKLVFVSSYNVLPFLSLHLNRFGAMLADGWFAGSITLSRKCPYGNRPPEIAMRLTLTFEDGSVTQIDSDESFRYTETEVRYADFYMGTMIDHRYLSPAEITMPGHVEGKPVQPGEGTPGEILPDYDLPVRDVMRMRPVSETKPADGKVILDFGQNFVGVIKLIAKGDAGGRIIIRHGEMLNRDGSLYTENLQGAKSIDVFICRGKGIETFVPTFTFHGFRYAEITAEQAQVLSVEGIVLTTDLQQNGDFSCDNQLINQLYSNIVWGMRGNFLELPTDCPQRDERLGWLGDAQVFIRTALYRCNCRDFYKKYMRNIRDIINPQGAPYELAPYAYGWSHSA